MQTVIQVITSGRGSLREKIMTDPQLRKFDLIPTEHQRPGRPHGWAKIHSETAHGAINLEWHGRTGVGLLHGNEIEKKSEEKEAEVGPPEDLMREHGVLKRVLLIYGKYCDGLMRSRIFRLRLWLTLQESFAASWKIITRSLRRIFF